MAQPYRDLPGVRPLKEQAERQDTAPASSLRQKRQAPAPNQRHQARIIQPPPTQAVRNQFIAPVDGARGHPGISHREPECATSPPTSDSDSPWATAWGFCTTRSLPAACRRRVEPPCSAIPPASHTQAAETRHNRPPQPAPRAGGSRTPHSCARASSHYTRTSQQSKNQKIQTATNRWLSH